jgi:hypothetical protein
MFLRGRAIVLALSLLLGTACTKQAPVLTADTVSADAALAAVGPTGFTESPQQIPATVVEVGILRLIPYLSYRIGEDREMNIYGDPAAPVCIEIGLYRSLLNNPEEQQRCGRLLQALFPDLNLKTVRFSGGKSLKGDWVIEVTLPDAPDAYGGWWISIYNLSRIHAAVGTSANISTVSEPAITSESWSPQERRYARPGSQAQRYYLRSYTRENGSYVPSRAKR